jgi:hypothetical protein
MKPRTAPVCRVLGGLSLALLCVPIGHELMRDEMFGPPPPEPVAAAPEDPATAATSVAQERSRLGDLPSTLPLGAGCAPSCYTLLASSGEAWDPGHARAALVSAPPVEELPPAGAAGMAIAFAQAAVMEVPSTPTQRSRYEPVQPTMPAMPARPGGLWLQPVISALLEPADPATTASTEPPPRPAEPQGEGAPPAAVPPDAQAAPPLFDPSSTSPAANAGAPFKRGDKPSEKPGARSESPLPYGPAPNGTAPSGNLPARGPAGTPDGTDPATSFVPVSDAPNAAPVATPAEAPRWNEPVFNGGGPAPATPSPQPLIEGIGPVVERIAGGDPGPGESPALTPRLEAALPSLLLVVAAVPEPTSLTLFAIAGCCLAGLRRARRR